MLHGHFKTVTVSDEMPFCRAIVVAKYLLVQVAEEMERFYVNVGALQTALEKAPEVFQTVCMDLPINVALGMVNRLVHVIAIQTDIGHKRIGINRALCLDVCANVGLQVSLLAGRNDIGVNLPAALQDAHDGRFALHATVNNLLTALI